MAAVVPDQIDPGNSVRVPEPPVKPRWRGVLHSWAAAVAVLAGIPLVIATAVHRGFGPAVGVGVYAVTVVGLFTVSAAYHRRTWTPRARARMRRLDHSMIFVFIAGTFTALSVLALTPATATKILLVVWFGALMGLLLALEVVPAPRWLNVVAYLSLGWAGVFVIPDVARHAGIAALVLVAMGGAFYSLGAIAYGTRRPRLSAEVFGFHEVFHLCTIVAALCHYIAIWLAVYR
jgi:hemolysin III